jgi:hypothetical protein
LPGVHRGRAEIADLAEFDDVVQGFHRLLDGCIRIEAMDLVEIDVMGAEPSEGGIHLLEDGLAGEALPAGAVVHLAEHLGCQHDVLAAGVTLDGATNELLGGAVLIDVRGVPERDAHLDGLDEERLGCVVVKGPPMRVGTRAVAVAHAAQRETADS